MDKLKILMSSSDVLKVEIQLVISEEIEYETQEHLLRIFVFFSLSRFQCI